MAGHSVRSLHLVAECGGESTTRAPFLVRPVAVALSPPKEGGTRDRWPIRASLATTLSGTTTEGRHPPTSAADASKAGGAAAAGRCDPRGEAGREIVRQGHHPQSPRTCQSGPPDAVVSSGLTALPPEGDGAYPDPLRSTPEG
jgi:hypothetical protein